MKKLQVVNYNIEDLVDLIIERLEEEGFENVEWGGDRGGEWIYGERESKEGDESIDLSLDITIEVEEEEVYE